MKKIIKFACWIIMIFVVLSCEQCDDFAEGKEYVWDTTEPEVEETQVAPTLTPELASQAEVLYSVGNPLIVRNGGTPPSFSLAEPYQVTQIDTYHWNDGQGATPGTIALEGSNGVTYGPWQARGLPGQGGVENAYWVVEPNIRLDPGSYKVIDSDPSTWATNDEAGGVGMMDIVGFTTK